MEILFAQLIVSPTATEQRQIDVEIECIKSSTPPPPPSPEKKPINLHFIELTFKGA